MRNFVLAGAMDLKTKILIKAAVDYVIILATFPIWGVIMLFAAIVIKISYPKESVFFTQKRVGRFEKPFNCYKFRSMYKNGREILAEYLAQNPDEVAYYAKYHKYQNDPRITKIGHFIRKTSIDELPQLFNILKFEMSLVGPRPYMISEKKKIGEAIKTITRVRPGLTGLWQVSGRNDVSFSERVQLDVKYVGDLSIFGDFWIILKTFVIVFRGS